MMILTGPDGKSATTGDIRIEHDGKIYGRFVVNNAKLWSPETPNQYKLKVQVFKGQHEIVDAKEIKTGIRTISVSREGGFRRAAGGC